MTGPISSDPDSYEPWPSEVELNADWSHPLLPVTERQALEKLLEQNQPPPDAELVAWRYGSVATDRMDLYLLEKPGIAVRDALRPSASAQGSQDGRIRISLNDELDELKDLERRPVWSLSYAAFLLHGYVLENEADGPHAISILESNLSGGWSEVARVLRTYKALTFGFSPRTEATPPEILQAAESWPEEIFPAVPFFGWSVLNNIVAGLRAQNELLMNAEEYRREYVRIHNLNKERAVKQDRFDRAIAYLVVLLSRLFPSHSGNSAAMARELTQIVEDTFPGGHKLRLGKTRITEMLEEGAALAGIQLTDGRKGPKVKDRDKSTAINVQGAKT